MPVLVFARSLLSSVAFSALPLGVPLHWPLDGAGSPVETAAPWLRGGYLAAIGGRVRRVIRPRVATGPLPAAVLRRATTTRGAVTGPRAPLRLRLVITAAALAAGLRVVVLLLLLLWRSMLGLGVVRRHLVPFPASSNVAGSCGGIVVLLLGGLWMGQLVPGRGGRGRGGAGGGEGGLMERGRGVALLVVVATSLPPVPVSSLPTAVLLLVGVE